MRTLTTNERADLLDATCDLLRSTTVHVETLHAHDASQSRGIARIIESVNTGYIGAPEIESAIDDLLGLQDFGAEDIAREVIIEAGLREAESLGYNTTGYACDINFARQ